MAALLPRFILALLGCALCACTALAAGPTYRVIPADSARLMWENGDGYCGEVSLQVAGLRLGFWVGQNQARTLAGGEALLDVNYDTLLNKLHLWHTNWSGGVAFVDAQDFLDWLRRALSVGNPAIFAVKTHDTWGTDNDYDHILNADAVNVPALEPPLLSITMLTNQQCRVVVLNPVTNLSYQLQWSPALGNSATQWSVISTGLVGQTSFTTQAGAASGFFRVAASLNQYDANNALYYADGIDGTERSLSFSQWVYGYTNETQYYYLPPKAFVTLVDGAKVNSHGYQYGTVLTGQDGDAECLPITLTSVNPQSEPNVTLGESPTTMSATVTMTGLTPGTHYALLRWDATSTTIGSVPWSNFFKAAAATNFEWQFTASSPAAVRTVALQSDGITLFRCVTAP